MCNNALSADWNLQKLNYISVSKHVNGAFVVELIDVDH